MRYLAPAVVVAAFWSTCFTPVAAQWIRYPTAGVPRTRDGKPNLTARTPRTLDGKPDLSGVWQNDGYGPQNQEGVDDPKAYTKPWTVSVNQHIALDTDLLEYACLENEKDVPRLVGK